MPIIEVPFIWQAFCTMPRCRKPSLVGVLDRVPARLRSADGQQEAPTVAEFRAGSRRIQKKHVPVEGAGDSCPPEFGYRAFDGALWRPVGCKPRGERPRRVGRDLSAFEDNWMQLVGAIDGQMQAFQDAYCTLLDIPQGPEATRVGYTSLVNAADFAAREIEWSDQETRQHLVVSSAERSFAFIDGELHCRTTGPAYSVNTNHTPDSGQKGVLATSDVLCACCDRRFFRGDRPETAQAWARSEGLDDRLDGDITIVDAERLSELMFDPEIGLIHRQATYLAWPSSDTGWTKSDNLELQGLRFQVRQMLQGRIGIPDAADAARLEELMIAAHKLFPLYEFVTDGMVKIDSPLQYGLDALAWRREFAARADNDARLTGPGGPSWQ